MVIVITSDNQRFNVTCQTIIQSKSISCQLKPLQGGITCKLLSVIDLPLKRLSNIAESCKPEISAAYKETGFGVDGPRRMTEWEKKFIPADTELLLEIINAAEALELTELLNFSCKALAEWMKDRSVQEVRDQLNFESDFKPLDEPMHAKEMLWITKQ
ncbi:hypothetical protein DSO57_1016228 [Entomophthora muscae]|uniref:Uncharacterized protein n=1 Tax=Entomophthora muscae TaxID=34485 RepID=A0ACC2RJH8_9FUNG|nr:hypothetical protein DSO57_1016228 [Entomophthora muscae]